MYEFCMIILSQSMGKKQNYVTWIRIVSLLIFLLKTFFEDIHNDIEKWFDKSNYDEKDNRPLPIGIDEKVIGMFKDELGGKIMKEFCAPRAKTYAYLMDDDSKKKKAEGTKKCIIKHILKFSDYYDSIFENKNMVTSQQRFTNDHHTIYTEKINKIAISSNDDKRIQAYDKVKAYPYGTSVFEICEIEIKALIKILKG